MSNIFSQIQNNPVDSNTFDLSHDKKLSTKMGLLVPIMVMDTVPGDTMTIKSNVLLRFAPLIAPVMHRVNVYIHYFFVPNRILWPGFEDFITGGRLGDDSTVWTHHDYAVAAEDKGSLSDYMGLPVNGDQISGGAQEDINISPLPFAAYQKIYNDYYRDQNQEDEVPYELTDGLISNALWAEISQIRTRAYEHDYFTSALPWTQKGSEALLPLGLTAPVKAFNGASGVNEQQFKNEATTALISGGVVGSSLGGYIQDDNTNTKAYIDLMDSHYADLSAATAASINDLRRAFRLQEWLEKNARGGSRYTESIKVHFNVNSSDKRLQRAEYIGGLKTPVKISEVLQTSNNDTQETPQGNMAGHGISVGGGDAFSYYCEEHGYIIGIMSVLPRTAYQQGVPKHFMRNDKFDYFWPSFANIGEQPIYNKELFLLPGTHDDVFGYTPRYAEYKFMNNTVHGDFKGNLDFWHLSRKFSAAPALNNDFLKCDYEDVERIFAVQDETDNLWCQVLNEVYAKRKMPIFGTPTL